MEREHNDLHTVCRSGIAPGVSLTCVKTDKFKTGCISVNLVSGLRADTAASSALLPRVLRRGTSELSDMERIAMALDELYGARIEPIIRKKGELHCPGFYADFPDDRYIPHGGQVLEKTVSMLGDMFLSPDTREGLLRADYIESEKKNLVDDIRAAVNDKRGYSISRLLEEMCPGEAYGVHKLGREEDALIITPETLTSRYLDLIANSRIEVFYCGSAEPELIGGILCESLLNLPERGNTPQPKTEIILYPAGSSPKRFKESLDVMQGKLAIGFRLGKAMEGQPDYPALMVFNSVYGAGDTSKLFLNVREKLSLCYYVGSMIDKHKGVLIVSSGVEFSDYDAALDEIMTQLRHVKSGDVSDWELKSAKLSVITSIKQAMDRPGGLEELYFDSTISEFPCAPDDLCHMVEEVTLDRIVGCSSEVSADSIYFLTGEGGDGDYD